MDINEDGNEEKSNVISTNIIKKQIDLFFRIIVGKASKHLPVKNMYSFFKVPN